MTGRFHHPVVIRTAPSAAPLDVDTSTLCTYLNADLLDGQHASEFAPVSHSHDAASITSGLLDPERIGDGTPADKKALIIDGATQTWRNLGITDITDITDYGASIIQTLDGSSARSILGAAAASHTHDAADTDRGVFAVARLGNGTGGSSSVLTCNSSPSSPGNWRTLAYSDVTGAVGSYGTIISDRFALWHGASSVKSSPLRYSGGFVAVGTGNGFAVDDDQLYVGGVKLPKPPSDTQLYGLRANGATGAAWEVITSGRGYTLLANTNAVTVSSATTTETTLVGTLRSGESTTLSTFSTGSIIKVELSGIMTSDAENWASRVLSVYFGSSRKITFSTLDEDSYDPADYFWRVSIVLMVTTAGSSATTVLSGVMEYEYPNDSDTSTVRRVRHITGTASGTLDTTTSNTFNATFNNAGSTGLALTCNNLIVTSI